MHPWNCIFISPSNAEGSFPARKTIAAKAFLLTTQHREFGVISTSSSINYNWNEILHYFEPPYTSAILDGMSSIIQNIKRRARGFRNDEYLQMLAQ